MDKLAVIQFQQITTQIEESFKIMCKTGNPETFFSRRGFLYKRINDLAEWETRNNYVYEKLNSQSLFQHYQEKEIAALKNCYGAYVFKALGELKSETAIEKRIDKFWGTVSKYINNADQIRDLIGEPFGRTK